MRYCNFINLWQNEFIRASFRNLTQSDDVGDSHKLTMFEIQTMREIVNRKQDFSCFIIDHG